MDCTAEHTTRGHTQTCHAIPGQPGTHHEFRCTILVDGRPCARPLWEDERREWTIPFGACEVHG